MNALPVADRTSEWARLKALVLESGSSPFTKSVYNLAPVFATHPSKRQINARIPAQIVETIEMTPERSEQEDYFPVHQTCRGC
jgi:hypothetical protein